MYIAPRGYTSAWKGLTKSGCPPRASSRASSPCSMRQHTSAYVSIRQHTSSHASSPCSMRQHTSAYVSIRQHASAYELTR